MREDQRPLAYRLGLGGALVTRVIQLFAISAGVLLTAEAFDRHIDKGYVYFAMGYALLVELVNMRLRKNKIEKRAAALSPEAQG